MSKSRLEQFVKRKQNVIAIAQRMTQLREESSSERLKENINSDPVYDRLCKMRQASSYFRGFKGLMLQDDREYKIIEETTKNLMAQIKQRTMSEKVYGSIKNTSDNKFISLLLNIYKGGIKPRYNV